MTPTLARMVGPGPSRCPGRSSRSACPAVSGRPQRGRLREFFQWNVDIVGTDDVLADAECIFVMIDFLREVGLTPAEAVMKINSPSLLAALLTARGFGPERHESIYGVLDKRDKLPPEAFIESLAKIAGASKIDILQEIGQARGLEGLDTLAGSARQQGGRGRDAPIAQPP